MALSQEAHGLAVSIIWCRDLHGKAYEEIPPGSCRGYGDHTLEGRADQQACKDGYRPTPPSLSRLASDSCRCRSWMFCPAALGNHLYNALVVVEAMAACLYRSAIQGRQAEDRAGDMLTVLARLA